MSDVVYIRSIDIIVQSENGFEDDGEATVGEFIEENEQVKVVVFTAPPSSSQDDAGGEGTVEGEESVEQAVVPVPGVRMVEIDQPTQVLDPAYAAFVRADAINGILMKSDADDLPAGFMRFISVTGD